MSNILSDVRLISLLEQVIAQQTNNIANINQILELFEAPGVDGVLNEYINQVIGNKEDTVKVPYVEANSLLAFIHTMYYHIHGKAFLYPLRETAQTLTSGAVAWSQTAPLTEIIPANTLNYAPFDLHFAFIYSISANSYGVVDFYADAAGTQYLDSAFFSRTAVQAQEGFQPLHIQQQLVNTPVFARACSDPGNISVQVRLKGHYYKI